MTSYRSALQGREQIAHGTVAFHFEKPSGFSFKSGQVIDVLLADARTVDVQSGRHTFSIVSAPFESELTIAARMRDSTFKRALASLPVGSLIEIEGPFGSLILHNDLARAAILIAGGIGITPFMSFLRQATHDQRKQRLVLLYSNRRPEDAAFLSELQSSEERNLNFRLIATMTLMSASVQPWEGQTGMVNEALLKSAVEGLPNPVYYVAGPPGLVAGMRQTLHDSGVMTTTFAARSSTATDCARSPSAPVGQIERTAKKVRTGSRGLELPSVTTVAMTNDIPGACDERAR